MAPLFVGCGCSSGSGSTSGSAFEHVFAFAAVVNVVVSVLDSAVDLAAEKTEPAFGPRWCLQLVELHTYYYLLLPSRSSSS